VCRCFQGKSCGDGPYQHLIAPRTTQLGPHDWLVLTLCTECCKLWRYECAESVSRIKDLFKKLLLGCMVLCNFSFYGLSCNMPFKSATTTCKGVDSSVQFTCIAPGGSGIVVLHFRSFATCTDICDFGFLWTVILTEGI
jgi:hypothetical protein